MTLRQPLFSVLPRSRASAVLLLACLALATTATTIVAAVPLYADAIEQAAFRRSLTDASATESGLEASVRTGAAGWAETSATIDDIARRRLPGELRTVAIAETDSFRFEDGRFDDGVITSLAMIESDEDLLTIADGSFDGEATDGHAPVWLSTHAADELGLVVGDRLVLDGRADGPLAVELVATFEPTDEFDELWFEQPDVVDAVEQSGSFTDVGPFVTDTATFATLTRPVTGTWRGLVVPASVTMSDLPEMRRGAQGFEVALRDGLGDPTITVTTGLPGLLASTDVAVGTTTAVIAVILVQLVLLALYGLSFAASVLASTRTGEAMLLRSRGATVAQTGALAAAEALLVVVPAVIAGPIVARAVIGVTERWGPVAASGLDLDARTSNVSLIAAIGVGLIAVAVIAWPAVRSARALAEARAETHRVTKPGVLQRTGADLAVALLAVVALWQLTRSSVATRDLSGRIGTDPVLVLAPALGVIAASLITLRVIRLVATAVQSRAAAGTGLSSALAGWELARRPARTTRTSVLIVLSVTVGTFAAVLGSSWQQSRRDQADAVVSADVRVVPDDQFGIAITPVLQAGAYAALPGVTDAVPIGRPVVTITRDLGRIATVATDTRRIGPLVQARPDLVDAGADLERLHAPADLHSVPLGEVTGDLTVDVEVQQSGSGAPGKLSVAMSIVDRFGTIHRLESEPFDPSETHGPRTLRFPLTTELVSGFDASAIGPISLLEVEVTAPTARVTADVMDSFHDEEPDEEPGEMVVELQDPARFDLVLSGFSLGAGPVALDDRPWSASADGPGPALLMFPAAAVASSAEGLSLSFESGLSDTPGTRARAVATTVPSNAPSEQSAVVVPPGYIDLTPTGPIGAPSEAVDAVVPAFVTPGLLRELGLEVGQTAAATIDGTEVDLRIDGVVEAVPFAVDQPIAMLVDWPTMVSYRYLAGDRNVPPTDWALSVDPAEASGVTAALGAEPFLSREVMERWSLARQLSDDPLAVGLLGSLGFALVTSLLVAVIGLLLTAVVGARERRSSYAVLTAMGAPRRVLRRWLVLEVVPLVAVSAIAGLTAGLLLSWMTLETLTVAGDGSKVVPTPSLVVPWTALGVVVGVAFAAGVALPLVTGRLLRRHSAADDLRIGDQA